MIDLYSKWGNYIPQDIRKQFEKEWLEIEKLEAQNIELRKYVDHDIDCPQHWSIRKSVLPFPCNCGLNKLLEK